MGKPSISYDDDEMANVRQMKEREAARLNAEARAKKLEEQQEKQEEPDYEEDRPVSKKKTRKAELVKEVQEEKIEEQDTVVEEEEIEETNEVEKEVSEEKIRIVTDAKGNEIPVDETLEDPFANLDSGEAGVIDGEVNVQAPVATAPKDLPKKVSKESAKVESSEDENGDVIISGTPPAERKSNIVVDEEQSAPKDEEKDETEEVEKKDSSEEQQKKDENALVSDNGTEKPFEEQATQKKYDDLFEGIDTTGSLADIDIVDNTNLMDVADSTNRIFTAPVFQVTALKSAYVAYMTALTFKDRDIFNRSDVDRITYNRNLFRMVYDRIDHTSVGKMSFSDFMKITAWEDLPTLLFGIYRQTFPGNSEIMLKCNHCEEESRVTIDPNSFIVTKSEEATEEIQELIKDLNSRTNLRAIDILKESQVNKLKRTRLPHSKIIIDISNPSLERFITIAAYFNKRKEESENMPSLVSAAIFIDKIYVPNIRISKERGKLTYDKVENLPDILKILGRIDTEDEFRLKEKVLIRKDKYTVDYKVRNVLCPRCKKIIDDVDVDLENLLFLATNLAVTFRTLPTKQNA